MAPLTCRQSSAAAIADNALGFDVIKQHAGLAQAERKVKVKVPGKHVPAEQKEFFWGTAVEAAHLGRLPSPPRQTNQAAGCGHRRPVHAPGNVQPAAGKKAPGPLEAQSCPGDGRRRVLLRVFVRRVLTAPLSLRHQVLSGLRPLLRDACRHWAVRICPGLRPPRDVAAQRDLSVSRFWRSAAPSTPPPAPARASTCR